MIRFARPLDTHSYRIFKDAFERISDELDDEYRDKEETATFLAGGSDRSRQFGGTQEIIRQIDLLHRAFNSKRMWQVTDWHWYLIYQAVSDHIDLHNDSISSVIEEKEQRTKESEAADQKGKSSKKKTKAVILDNEASPTKPDSEDYYNDLFHTTEIDFGSLVEDFFWDKDFLLPQSVAGSPQTQAAIGLSDETIQFIDLMPARPQDLAIEECPECWEEWKAFLENEEKDRAKETSDAGSDTMEKDDASPSSGN